MKRKLVKSMIKGMTAFAMATVLFFSMGEGVNAATSDQVQLSPSKPGIGTVNTVSSTLYVRSNPDLSSEILAYLPSQEPIMLVQRLDQFYKVQYDTAGHYGYVYAPYIYEWSVDYYHVANTGNNGLNLRDYPETGSIYLSIPSGKAFPEENTAGSNWSLVLYGPQEGYVCTLYTIKYAY